MKASLHEQEDLLYITFIKTTSSLRRGGYKFIKRMVDGCYYARTHLYDIPFLNQLVESTPLVTLTLQDDSVIQDWYNFYIRYFFGYNIYVRLWKVSREGEISDIQYLIDSCIDIFGCCIYFSFSFYFRYYRRIMMI